MYKILKKWFVSKTVFVDNIKIRKSQTLCIVYKYRWYIEKSFLFAIRFSTFCVMTWPTLTIKIPNTSTATLWSRTVEAFFSLPDFFYCFVIKNMQLMKEKVQKERTWKRRGEDVWIVGTWSSSSGEEIWISLFHTMTVVFQRTTAPHTMQSTTYLYIPHLLVVIMKTWNIKKRSI